MKNGKDIKKKNWSWEKVGTIEGQINKKRIETKENTKNKELELK